MSNNEHPRPAPPTENQRSLGLPVIALIGLALLGVPRVILHDLDILTEGTLVNGLFVFVPLVIWIGITLWKRVPNPFLTLLVTGAIYGAFLAFGHQILWNASFDGQTPQLGGNLPDLDSGVQEIIFRAFATASSMFTGVMVGVITGLLAWLIRTLWRTTGTDRSAPSRGARDGQFGDRLL